MLSKSHIKQLYLGAAYYPEHWDPARWAEDIALMQRAGLTVVRMGEFAWSTLEPEEGRFSFDWLEHVITQLAEAGIVTVLGTPTAAPPAWLVEKHPSLLAVDENGKAAQFGNRCHYCVNSPELHAATRAIVGALAECFGKNPHVIGWQIDNEFNRVCYCDRCRHLFTGYLAAKFGSLDVLNDRWSTRYWSQTYSGWEQIPIPIGQHNPGLMLEFKRFVTDSYRAFERLQIDLLKPRLRPDVWITHNFMGWFNGYDHYALADDLDLAAWDWYVSTGHFDYTVSGAAHDLVRGLKRRNFWVMETQAGNVNWSQVNSSLDRGEARSMAWHAVAHGANGVLYWQWRSALGGQEQFCGTIVDQAGKPRPFFDEVRQLGAEFAAADAVLADSEPVAEIALLNSYESRWSIEWQRHHAEFDYVTHFLNYYRPLAARNMPVDIISAHAPLDSYRLVIAPALIMVDEEQTERLRQFVERGGHLVLTIRTGMKDAWNAMVPRRQPGLLAEIAGVEVEDYYALLDPVPLSGDGLEGSARVWAERLAPLDGSGTVVLARYGKANGWLDGQPAITAHAHGRGRVYMIGAYLDSKCQDTILQHITSEAGIRPIMETPPGVEVDRRVKKSGEQILFVMNHTDQEQSISLDRSYLDHLRGVRLVADSVVVPPREVLLLSPCED